MTLVYPFRLASTVLSAREELNKVADLVQKRIGKEEAVRFREALNNNDALTVNQILDKMVEVLTNEKSVSEALYQFVRKFLPSLSEAVFEEPFDFKKIIIINQHYNELKTAMGG